MSINNKLKHYFQDLFRYPKYYPNDESYDTYWQSRDTSTLILNSFQKYRADFVLEKINHGDSVLDIGCGDGKILAYLKSKKQLGHLVGVDSSSLVLEKALERGISVYQKDIREPQKLDPMSNHDVVILFEVLEHIIKSEGLLQWAKDHARKFVAFSVPNTGFILYRLRLLLGRFPLQWRSNPSEHIRFWTVKDMHWWLKALGHEKYELHLYEGLPIINKLWPSLFAQGIFVILKP